MSRHRIQLDFSETTFKEIETLKEEMGMKNCTSFVINAVSAYIWLIKAEKKGNHLILEDVKSGEQKWVHLLREIS